MNNTSFRAPWGAPLVVMTAACTLACLLLPLPGIMVCLGSSVALRALALKSVPPALLAAAWLLVLVPFILLVLSLFYMVRGYAIAGKSLIIKRFGWKTRFDLSNLVSATIDPEAFRGSMRLFGNAGFFSFTGWFRNKKLGRYRAFATDAPKAVVLKFYDKTIVITPDDPVKFVTELNALKPAAA